MMKLVFNVVVLVMITIGLTPLPTKTTSLAAPAPASATAGVRPAKLHDQMRETRLPWRNLW